MKKITRQNLHPLLSESLNDTDFVLILNALIKFIRRGSKKQAAEHFDLIITTLKQDEALCRHFSRRFYTWLSQVHIYPALIKLGIFSRHSFSREMGIRIYERFSPSYKDFANLREVFLYLFHSENDDKWLQTLHIRQWLGLYELIRANAEPTLLQTACRQLADARCAPLKCSPFGLPPKPSNPTSSALHLACLRQTRLLSPSNAKLPSWSNTTEKSTILTIPHILKLCSTNAEPKSTTCTVEVRVQVRDHP